MELTTGIALYGAILATVVGSIAVLAQLQRWKRDRQAVSIESELCFDRGEFCAGIDVINVSRKPVHLVDVMFELDNNRRIFGSEEILKAHYHLLPATLDPGKELHIGVSISEISALADRWSKDLALRKVIFLGRGNKEYVGKIDGREIRETIDQIMNPWS